MIAHTEIIPPTDKRERRRRIRVGHDVARAFARVYPPVLTLREIGDLMGMSAEGVRLLQALAFYTLAMRLRALLENHR